MKSGVKPIPDGYHSLTPYLTATGAAAAIEFYQRAFGAKEVFQMPGPDGKILHAEITIGDSRLMLADESDGSVPSSQKPTNRNQSIFLYVEDVDATYKQAILAGAEETVPVQDKFWGDRFGELIDPFGHKWMLATHVEDVAPEVIGERAAAAFSK